jgi:hypothetical protein
MPPRWLSAVIVVFWLGMTGWLAWREYWPRWQTGGPPPYHIDLVDEAQRTKPRTLWVVIEDGRQITRAESWVDYNEKDRSFALLLEFRKQSFSKQAAGGLLPRLRWRESLLRVTLEGSLRELKVRADVHCNIPLLSREPIDGTLVLAGEVRGEHFFPRYRVEQNGLPLLEGKLSPVEVSYHGSVLVPQHPVNKITGLRPGQSWRMPVVDPFAATFGLADAVRHVNARVLPTPQVLEWSTRPPKTCLVIEYEGEDERAATWVEVGTGLVQRQEAAFAGHRLVLQRDD